MTIIYLPLSFTAVNSASWIYLISSLQVLGTLRLEPIPVGSPSSKDSIHRYYRACGSVNVLRVGISDLVCQKGRAPEDVQESMEESYRRQCTWRGAYRPQQRGETRRREVSL
jgi:hypothetical protein